MTPDQREAPDGTPAQPLALHDSDSDPDHEVLAERIGAVAEYLLIAETVARRSGEDLTALNGLLYACREMIDATCRAHRDTGLGYGWAWDIIPYPSDGEDGSS
jgi:hypothetical protein